MGFKVEIKGLRELQARIEQIPSELDMKINAQLQRGAEVFVAGAQRDAPVDVSFLKQGISYMPKPVHSLHVSIVSNSAYSAYMEFGTKSRVQVPPQYQAYAAQSKGIVSQWAGVYTKTGKGFYDNILAWVKRKGIGALRTKAGNISKKLDSVIAQEQAAFAIYLSIMRNGVKPHPFFFKQLPIAVETIETGIVAEINGMKL